MAVNLVSPGVKIREVDLTIGRIEPINDQVAAFVGPFEKGPVGKPVLIQTENQLKTIFGKPKTENNQNAYWLTASNYLSYGGVLQLVRIDSKTSLAMGNAYAPISAGIGSTGDVKIKSIEDYKDQLEDYIKKDTNILDKFTFAAKNPGTWANNLTIYTIDGAADQIISGIDTTSSNGIKTGYGVSITITNRQYGGIGVAASFTGYLKGIITGVGKSSIDVKLVSIHSTITEPQYIDYSKGSPLYSIKDTDSINIYNNNTTVGSSRSSFTVKDWFEAQTVNIGNSTVYWKNITDRPSTSQYVNSNGGKNDEFNIIVVDTDGKVNGNVGEILETHSKLSKAKDGKISPIQSTYYVDYIRDNSAYIFVGGASSTSYNSNFGSFTGFSTYTSGGTWGDSAANNFFKVEGNRSYTLKFGTNYETTSGITSTYKIDLTSVTEAYDVFENPAEYKVDFIINGPSGGDNVYEAQAKANHIISIVESRKDCIAVISADESSLLNETKSSNQTDKIIDFFNGVTPSTYAVFDSGYKYTYDRENNSFLYLACNSDVAGLMARTSINQYPWYSPAGASRGIISNAFKLAYNPSENQRDSLYSNNINPIIAAPGQGIMLYGDKTASAYQSAFDRINVRRLFLTLEKTIEKAARSQLFEFNDPITRNNFVNIVEPYLRDVRAKRGITEFLLVCDESNNTPDVIDSNQFKADIYIKPARSINFIGLTFVATRTGILFSEIVGTV